MDKPLTIIQLIALRYAKGEHDMCPSAYIANKLERLGLIVARKHNINPIIATSTHGRAWTITVKGKKVLKGRLGYKFVRDATDRRMIAIRRNKVNG